MELEQIRKRINEVDDEMHHHFADRLWYSKEVAETKLQTGDSVYKPERERQVFERFPGEQDEEKLYRLYVRKVMQLSRYHQYGIFLKQGIVDAEFETLYTAVKKALGESGNTDVCVKIELTPDPQRKQGISKREFITLMRLIYLWERKKSNILLASIINRNPPYREAKEK